MSRYLIVLIVLACAGCNEDSSGRGAPTMAEWEVDQSIRREVFTNCLKNLPAGPNSAKYNDWDEVVDSCASTAYYQAMVCVSGCKLKQADPPRLPVDEDGL